MAIGRRAAHALAPIDPGRRGPYDAQFSVWTPYRRLVAFQHDALLVDLALEFEVGGDDTNWHALAFRWVSWARRRARQAEVRRSGFLPREGAGGGANFWIRAAAA